MGEVVVIQPRELLGNRLPRTVKSQTNRLPSTTKSQPQSTRNPGAAADRWSNRRKRSPPKNTKSLTSSNKTATAPSEEKSNNPKPSTDLVIGQIKILRRGEVLPTSSSPVKVYGDLEGKIESMKCRKVAATPATIGGLSVVSSTDGSGPEPDVVPKNVRVCDFYAGSAIFTSPDPSSLPLPVFFKVKKDPVDDCRSTNSDATSSLRRLLRLDLS